MKGNEGPAGPPGPAVSLGLPRGSGQEPGKGVAEGGFWAGCGRNHGPRHEGIWNKSGCAQLSVVLRSVVRGPGVLLPGGSDSISLSLRALLVSEVQQDQGAPLVPLGVQAHKVLLELQERKACR